MYSSSDDFEVKRQTTEIFFPEIFTAVFIPLLQILHLHQLLPDAALLHFPYEGGSCGEVQGSNCTVCCTEKEKPLSKLKSLLLSKGGEGRMVQPTTATQESKIKRHKKEVLAMATFAKK